MPQGLQNTKRWVRRCNSPGRWAHRWAALACPRRCGTPQLFSAMVNNNSDGFFVEVVNSNLYMTCIFPTCASCTKDRRKKRKEQKGPFYFFLVLWKRSKCGYFCHFLFFSLLSWMPSQMLKIRQILYIKKGCKGFLHHYYCHICHTKQAYYQDKALSIIITIMTMSLTYYTKQDGGGVQTWEMKAYS